MASGVLVADMPFSAGDTLTEAHLAALRSALRVTPGAVCATGSQDYPWPQMRSVLRIPLQVVLAKIKSNDIVPPTDSATVPRPETCQAAEEETTLVRALANVDRDSFRWVRYL